MGIYTQTIDSVVPKGKVELDDDQIVRSYKFRQTILKQILSNEQKEQLNDNKQIKNCSRTREVLEEYNSMEQDKEKFLKFVFDEEFDRMYFYLGQLYSDKSQLETRLLNLRENENGFFIKKLINRKKETLSEDELFNLINLKKQEIKDFEKYCDDLISLDKASKRYYSLIMFDLINENLAKTKDLNINEYFKIIKDSNPIDVLRKKSSLKNLLVS